MRKKVSEKTKEELTVLCKEVCGVLGIQPHADGNSYREVIDELLCWYYPRAHVQETLMFMKRHRNHPIIKAYVREKITTTHDLKHCGFGAFFSLSGNPPDTWLAIFNGYDRTNEIYWKHRRLEI